MRTPAEQLAALAIQHIEESPESRRADLLEAAAVIFADHGSALEAERLSTTAAMRRAADAAQRSLADLFKPEA